MKYSTWLCVLSVIAFLLVTAISYSTPGVIITPSYPSANSASDNLLVANIADDMTGFDPVDGYDYVASVTIPGVESGLPGSAYTDDLLNALSAVLDGFQALARPSYFTDLAYGAEAVNTNPEQETDRGFLAYNADFGTGQYINSDLFSENDKTGGLYYYYVASISPPRPPESSFDEITVSSSSSEDDGMAEEISDVGNSPLSTHSLFAALSISGTYPDNDIIEIELPPILRLGDKRISIGAGWLLPSGIELPVGGVIDDSADYSAYYLSVIIRF